MDSSLRDIILLYVDAALDVDDLENIGDYVRSVFTTESIHDWQVPDSLKKLHSELICEYDQEKNLMRKSRLKAAISYFEADFADYLIAKEIETLRGHN
jgi:hypothetical protein